jgi:hypothetical protein
MAGATAPAATQGYAAQYRSAATPDTPATHHDLRDWLRLPVAARHALSTPLPDSWWAVCARTAGAWALPGRSLTDAVTRTAVAIGVAATPSTRAPPARVN